MFSLPSFLIGMVVGALIVILAACIVTAVIMGEDRANA